MSRTTCAVAALLICLTSCSAPGGVDVEMDEYSITTGRPSERAGDVRFTGRNIGSIAHQLVIVRTRLDPDGLPVRSGIVDLDDDRIEVAGEIDLIAPGASEDLTVELSPGPHVLICNIAGHYGSGMRAGLRVTEAVTPAP